MATTATVPARGVIEQQSGSGPNAAPSRIQPGIRLGTVAGIEVRLDWSLLLVFFLIAFNLAAGLFPRLHPAWTPALSWAVACAAAIMFFASVLAHELAHALVGRRHGVEVVGITLFIFGGLARLKRDPRSAGAEFRMAIAGPLTSLAIGGAATALGWILAGYSPAGATPEEMLRRAGPAATLLLWLGPINLLLAVFNLLPGFPLDGGRVLRAAIWRATGDVVKATQWATGIGRALGLTLIFIGISMLFGARLPLFGTGLVQGLWLMLIGWLLNTTAMRSYQQVLMDQVLKGVTVGRVMRQPAAVPADATIEEIADRFLVASDQRCLPVADQGQFVGLVCISDLHRVPRRDWRLRPVREVMTPVGSLESATPDDEMVDVLRKLVGRDVDQLPVMADGQLVGMVRRADVLRWMEMKAPHNEPSA